MQERANAGGGGVAKKLQQKSSRKGTWDAEFGALPRVVGGAVTDGNQAAAAVITNQLLGTLDMSRPLNVAL